MRLTRPNRWALSLADLTLLMLAMLALVVRYPDAASANAADSATVTLFAQELFVRDEVMLTDKGQQRLQALVQKYSGTARHISIAVYKDESISSRMDDWEFAAARTALLGRYISKAGIADQSLQLNAPLEKDADNEAGSVVIKLGLKGGMDIAE